MFCSIGGNDFLFEVLGEAAMFSGVTMVGGQACISVVLENDARVDGDKEFQLMIETSTAYAIDQPSTTNVTITDDDSEFHKRECYNYFSKFKIPIPDFKCVQFFLCE